MGKAMFSQACLFTGSGWGCLWSQVPSRGWGSPVSGPRSLLRSQDRGAVLNGKGLIMVWFSICLHCWKFSQFPLFICINCTDIVQHVNTFLFFFYVDCIDIMQFYFVSSVSTQESPHAWTQEAHRPPRSKYTPCCTDGGGGCTPSLSWLGVPHPVLARGVPHPVLAGGVLLHLGLGYPLSTTG